MNMNTHHAQEEVWNVVSGEIVLVIDGHEHRLEAGDAAIVPPDVSPLSAGARRLPRGRRRSPSTT
jgi:quercetin dioxygenase-like cupin family protein